MDWTRGQTIGTGSTATVSLATCSLSGQRFAIKSTAFSNSESLQREQTILSSLSSPHIVSYKGYDISRDQESSNTLMYNLIMELVSGGTLSEAIRDNGGRLEEAAIGVLTRQIVQGLDYIHKLGLVHCDIKGQNILISDQGRVKIADFGCAKWENQGTNEARIGGTPLYMAPEVARGEEQGCSADIWALGCTMIEMATGSSPWPNAKDPISLLYRIAYSGELPPFPDCVSAEMKDFLAKCLNRDPRQRWTASQLLEHPFLGEVESSFVPKQIRHFNSPTSILDQDYWDSMEDSSSSQIAEIPKSFIDERIIRLASSMFTEESSWHCDEKWIMIR